MKTKLLAILLLIQGYCYAQTPNKESFVEFNKALNKIFNAYSSSFDSLKGVKTDNNLQQEWYSKINLAGAEKGKITLGLAMAHSEWKAQIVKTNNLKEAKKMFNEFSEVLNDCTFDCCKMDRNNVSKSVTDEGAYNIYSIWTVTKFLKRKNDKLQDAAIYLDIRQLEDKSYFVSLSVRSSKDDGQ